MKILRLITIILNAGGLRRSIRAIRLVLNRIGAIRLLRSIIGFFKKDQDGSDDERIDGSDDENRDS